VQGRLERVLDRPIALGRPIPNTTAYVLDSSDQPPHGSGWLSMSRHTRGPDVGQQFV
jgi:hypothetical protein